jgi:hypothetical protein
MPKQTSARELPAGLTAARAACSAKTMPCKPSVCHKSRGHVSLTSQNRFRTAAARRFGGIIAAYGNAMRAVRCGHDLHTRRHLLVHGVAEARHARGNRRRGENLWGYGHVAGDGNDRMRMPRLSGPRDRAAGRDQAQNELIGPAAGRYAVQRLFFHVAPLQGGAYRMIERTSFARFWQAVYSLKG